MTASLVSVLVPAFNHARYLPQCLASLTRQTYAEWECIIVDDGSTDDTTQLGPRLAEADPRVRYVRQPNRGPSAARNAAIREALGEFIQFLDADDLLEPEKLRVQAQFLRGHADTDIVAGHAAFFEDAAPRQQRAWSRPGIEGQGERALATLVAGNPLLISAPLVRRSVFTSVGLFDESLRGNEDWDFWLRCAASGCRFSFVSAGNDRALVRDHPLNVSASRSLMLSSAVTVRERLARSLPPPLQAENTQQLLELQCQLALELVQAGRVREGWRLYWRALRAVRRKSAALLRLPLLIPGLARRVRAGRRLNR